MRFLRHLKIFLGAPLPCFAFWIGSRHAPMIRGNTALQYDDCLSRFLNLVKSYMICLTIRLRVFFIILYYCCKKGITETIQLSVARAVFRMTMV